MKIVVFAGLSILCLACEKESSTNYKASLTSTTAHNIEIRPYYGGTSPSNKRVFLGNGEEFEIAEGSNWGKGDSGFDSKFFGAPDSIIVIFDGTFKCTHYVNTPGALANRYYLFSSLRNLMNPKSYQYKVLDKSKHEMNVSYTYSFTDQDYLDAQ